MTRFKATFLSLFLALGMILGTTTAYAAETRSGTEVWHLGEATVGSFVVENDNLTPVKTIGDDGKLFIWTQFSRADGSSYPPIVVTVELRDYDTGAVLDRVQYKEGETIDRVLYYPNAKKGQRIQVYWDISSQYNPPGPYRKANITYGYILYQDEVPPEGPGTD